MAVNYDYNITGVSVPDSRVRWRAVLAGVVAGMIVQVLLSLLGMAVGLNALDPAGADANARGVGIGSGFWLLLSAILSGFTGGWVAAALSNATNRLDGLLHGLLSWGTFMVIAAYLLGSGLGTMVGGVFNLTASTLSNPSQGVAAVREQVQDIVPPIQQTQTQTQQQPVRSEETADRAATATWGVFAVALLSFIASCIGGIVGLRSQPIARTTVSEV